MKFLKSELVTAIVLVFCLGAAALSGCGKSSEIDSSAFSVINESISDNSSVEEEQDSEQNSESESSAVDVRDYLDSYEQLVDILNMQKTEPWQFSVDTSYEADGFYLEWDDDESDAFSMKNEGNAEVLLYGIGIGDSLSDVPDVIDNAGWVVFWEGDSGYVYIKAFDSGYYYLDLEGNADGQLDNWYLNNWPEGDMDLDSVWNQGIDSGSEAN